MLENSLYKKLAIIIYDKMKSEGAAFPDAYSQWQHIQFLMRYILYRNNTDKLRCTKAKAYDPSTTGCTSRHYQYSRGELLSSQV